jgi:cobalt/nickel transport system ATP-binding protein
VTAPLETRGLTFAYPGHTGGLRDVSITVQAGRRTALLGPNGSGKSTLLLHLAGILPPAGGSLLLDGTPLGRDARSLSRWREAVGLVFQNPDDQLFGPTVSADVAMGPRNLGLPSDLVQHATHEALACLHLLALAERPIHALSAGEKRRVALAGVLAMRPRILLLDEPTAGLDAAAEANLLAALDARVEVGTAVVMATHDVALAREWADEVVVMIDGQVLLQGAAAALSPIVMAQARLHRTWTRRAPRMLSLENESS